MKDRASTPEEFHERDTILFDEEEIALREASNGLLQFDEVLRLAERYIEAGSFIATPELILNLNRIAIEGIRRSAGKFREIPIEISNTLHSPPPHRQVPQLVTGMCQYVNENWQKHKDDEADAIHLSAYLMWRLNWIHPFRDGNGRTSRAVSYLALCIRLGRLLPGTPTIADQIVDNRHPYYDALDAADAAWRNGIVDVTVMENLIRRLLIQQLSSID